MSVQIIDNFKLNTSLPIDHRIVVGGTNYYQYKEDIEYKYNGLRIWDLNTNSAWVWINTEWIKESSSILLEASNNYLPKVEITTSNKLKNSLIYDDGQGIGINTMTITSGTKLQVNGIIRSTSGGFYGNGANLTQLNASNITSGILPLLTLSGGGEGNVLVGTNGSAEWKSIGELVSNNIQMNDTNSNQFLVFTQGDGNSQLRINNTIRVNPRTNNVSIGINSLNNKLTVNGNVSIGTTLVAPANGLLVEGELSLRTVNKNSTTTNKLLTLNSNNIVSYTSAGMIPIGSIVMWSNSLIPIGWVFCDGSSYNTESGQISTPDLRERFIVCASSSINVPGAGYIVGQTGGENKVTLNLNQIPPHTHNLHGSVHQKQEPSTIGSERLYLFPNGPSGGSTSTISSPTGNNEPHENRPPYYALAFIMYVGNII
jgi:microcystin-dependent protein